MPDLCVTSAIPVRVSNSGKVKRVKRKPNDLGLLSTVSDFVYPGGNKKLAKDATAQPFKKKRKAAKRKTAPKKRKIGGFIGLDRRKANPSGKGTLVEFLLSKGYSRARLESLTPSQLKAMIRDHNSTRTRAESKWGIPKRKAKANRQPAKRKAANRKPSQAEEESGICALIPRSTETFPAIQKVPQNKSAGGSGRAKS